MARPEAMGYTDYFKSRGKKTPTTYGDQESDSPLKSLKPKDNSEDESLVAKKAAMRRRLMNLNKKVGN